MNTEKRKTPPTVNSKTFLLTMYCMKIKARRKFLGTLTVELFIFQFKHLTLIYNRIFLCMVSDFSFLFDHVITNSGGNFNYKTEVLCPTQDVVCVL